jgi:hypothetical protein
MKTLMFLPIAYVAGEHGFVFFAPYLAIVLATLHFARKRRAAQPTPVSEP